jgi:hypothetical protein
MPPVGFKTTITAGERPQTYALDRAVIGTGKHTYSCPLIDIVLIFAGRQMRFRGHHVEKTKKLSDYSTSLDIKYPIAT